MTQIAILVPCHLKFHTQFYFIKRCIKSLLNQTYKCDILLSISFESDELKNKFYDIIKNNFDLKNINYIECNEKKSQMEHLYNLSNHIKNYDYLTFCDDDDEYENDRIELLFKKINTMSLKHNIEYLGCSERPYKQPKTKNFLVAYASYMIKPIIFTTFFDKIKHIKKYLKSKDCWVLFNNYLQIILWKTNKIFYYKIYDCLYKMEYFNCNSVSAINECKKYSKKKLIKLYMKLSLFSNNNYKINDLLKQYNISIDKISNYISLKEFAELKNLVTQFHFIRF